MLVKDLDPAQRGSYEIPPSTNVSDLSEEGGSQRFSWRMMPWKSITTTFAFGAAGAVVGWFGTDLLFLYTEPNASKLIIDLNKTLSVPLSATLGIGAGILITHYFSPFREELRRIQNSPTSS